jgi:hypothetical protein
MFISYVHRSTSTKTGIHPFCIIGFIVVGNHAATVITSSQGLIRLVHNSTAVRAVNARRLAELHELQVSANLIHINSANSFSNLSFRLHSVQWQSKTDSIIY